MARKNIDDGQDFHRFLERYLVENLDDVVVVESEVSANQEITAVATLLAEQGRDPLLVFKRVKDLDVSVVTNMFASRKRIARLLDVVPAGLHEAYQAHAREACEPVEISDGPIMEIVEQSAIDLNQLPMLQHFETDRAPYITNGIIVCGGVGATVGNLSYHRAMLHSKTELATSLHSRGHLWRMLV